MQDLEKELKECKKGLIGACIGIGMTTAGFCFDYGIVDNIMIVAGPLMTGYYLHDFVRTIKLYNLTK
jgi:hypothetical protein